MYKLLLPWIDISEECFRINNINNQTIISIYLYESSRRNSEYRVLGYKWWLIDNECVCTSNEVILFNKHSKFYYETKSLAKQSAEKVLIKAGFKILSNKYHVML